MVPSLHLVVEFFGCDSNALSRSKYIKDVFLSCVKIADLHKIKSHFYQFNPHGVTGFVLLRESHISIHTWPEDGYAAIDAFTCGDQYKAFVAVEYLSRSLKPTRVVVKQIMRGREQRKDILVAKKIDSEQEDVFSKEILHKKTKFQTIVVEKHPVFGTMLRLDKEMQIASADEKDYSTPFVAEAFRLRPDAKRIAILGNGDCGVLREILAQPVEEAILVEIDKHVIDVAKKHFPAVVGSSLQDKRAKIVIADCFSFLEKERGFDALFVDLTTSPIGEEVSHEKIIALCKAALAEKGIVAIQSGYISEPADREIEELLRKEFKNTSKKTALIHSFSFVKPWSFNYGYN